MMLPDHVRIELRYQDGREVIAIERNELYRWIRSLLEAQREACAQRIDDLVLDCGCHHVAMETPLVEVES